MENHHRRTEVNVKVGRVDGGWMVGKLSSSARMDCSFDGFDAVAHVVSC